MRKSRFSEEQIVGMLKESGGRASGGGALPTAGSERCDVLPLEGEVRSMEVNEARRLRQLEEENRRLKQIVAQ